MPKTRSFVCFEANTSSRKLQFADNVGAPIDEQTRHAKSADRKSEAQTRSDNVAQVASRRSSKNIATILYSGVAHQREPNISPPHSCSFSKTHVNSHLLPLPHMFNRRAVNGVSWAPCVPAQILFVENSCSADLEMTMKMSILKRLSSRANALQTASRARQFLAEFEARERLEN